LTADEFRVRLHALGLSLGAFARLTGVHRDTAAYWGRDRPGAGWQKFPAWVPLLLAAWERMPDLLAA
jgi:hypothetical protein